MSFIKPKETKTVFGIILGNRDIFPDHLVKEGRTEILGILDKLGYEYVIFNNIVRVNGIFLQSFC